MPIEKQFIGKQNVDASAVPVMTVDGPSGAGKGTISRAIAKKLGWHYLDSGAIYRALAVYVIDQQITLNDEAVIAEQAAVLEVEFQVNDILSVILAKMDITDRLSTEQCGNAASKIAALPGVRKALLFKQRQFRQLPGLVADGRDMGTVVFPDAPCKIYLTASSKIRARRRYNQLKEKGIDVNLEKVVEELEIRDHRDRTRSSAPLKAAEDSVIIDSSLMTIDQVVDECLILLKK